MTPPASDPVQPAAASPAIPVSAILLLSAAAFASGLSMRVTDALLPHLAREFSVPLGSAANVITFFAIAYGSAQLFFGPVGDRFGKYFVIACACGASALSATLCGLASDFSLLVLARALAGATAAALIPLSMAWIGDVIPYERRQPVLARFLIGQILGLSAGVWLGGFSADHLHWRLPFFAIAAVFAAVSLLLFRLNRRLPAHARALHRVEGAALRRTFGEFRQVLARPWARVVIASVSLEGLFLYGAFAFIATHVHHVHGVSLSLSGSLVMLFGAGGFLFALASGVLVQRLGEVRLAASGACLMGLGLLLVALGPHWWWAVPGCFLAGLGFYMMHNTLQINATQMAPERRGAAVSAFASCFFIAQSAGVAIAGQLAQRIGTAPVIIGGAVGVVLVGISFSRLRRRSLAA